jgi:hypothetical protein
VDGEITMTNLIERFVDFATGEVTADVNNTATTTDDATINNTLSLGADTALTSVVASGSTTLSSGSATVDTGIGSGTTATFMVAFGPTTDDSEVAADIEAVSGGNYQVNIEETDTSVGNPTVEYDILRVR